MFIVIDEYAGSSDVSIGIFTTLKKAKKAFDKVLYDNDNHAEWEKIKDKEDSKEYYFTDGTYGWTVRLFQIDKNEMINIF